jgi:major capsid protein
MPRNPDFARDAARLERDWGIVMPFAMDYMPDDRMALDAQPTLITTPNAGIPAFFTQLVDPEVVRILQTPNKGAEILGEQKKGNWVDQTIFIPVVENTGEVSSYGDFNTNGRADVNEQWEQRQSYLFQTIVEYGDLEVERAGAAKLDLVSEKQTSAAKTLDKFMDLTYHFGITGLQNYGLLNDPSLPAALTPSTKAAGGVKWINNGIVNATAAEIYVDFQMLFNQLTTVSGGMIDADTAMTLVTPNAVNAALTAVNSFGITIRAFIKESFPNISYEVDPRYATTSGNVVHLIAKEFDGKKTGYCGFNEKSRDHQIVRSLSSYAQKRTAGTWGAIIRYPLAFAQMIGV